MGSGFLGILMLNTRFPRPLGDIGHRGSHPYPVRFHTVEIASVKAVVTRGMLDAGLVADFESAARHLERAGASAITTSCGFLIRAQATLAAAVRVPVVSSSLLAFNHLHKQDGNAPVGVITARREALDETALAAAEINADATVIEGMEACQAFADSILADNAEALDQDAITAGLVLAAKAIQRRAPDVRTILFECTNLGPYRKAVEAETGLRTYDILDACQDVMAQFKTDATNI